MSGAVEEAVPLAPVESEIGKLVAKILNGETVVVRGAPNPLTGFPRRYRLSAREDFPLTGGLGRLLVSYTSPQGTRRRCYVNNNEWVVRTNICPRRVRVEQEARAMLAAIFAGVAVCDFGCGSQINSDRGDGIVPDGY